MTEDKYNTKDIRHIDEKSQEYIAKGNRMTEDKDGICCSWYESCTYYMQCEHLYNENKDLSEDVYRLEQENKELKKEIESQKGLITEGGKQQYNMTMAYDKCKTALEEIRENLVKLETNDEDDFTYEYSKIEDRINEVLNESK